MVVLSAVLFRIRSVPDNTPTDSPSTPGASEPELHPEFVMPVLDETIPLQDALLQWDRDMQAQALAAYPAEDQWLQRACFPGPVPAVPLSEFHGTLQPPAIVAHRDALSARLWKIR